MDLTVIIPVFNEEKVIEKVICDLRNDYFENILVINDGSSDRTIDILMKLNVNFISHSYNKGYGASLKTGIRNSTTEYVAIYDGDGQHKPSELKKLINVAKEGEYDMVTGSRDKNSYQVNNRKLGKRIIKHFVNKITKHKVPDFNSGLRIFRRNVISRHLNLMPDGFSFSTTSTVAFFKFKYDIKYIPINVIERTGRKSNIKLNDGFKTLMLILNLSVLFSPQALFLPISLFFVSSSFIYFILYSIINRIHITSSMTLLFITGILIFFIGVICEQISAIRREQHN